MYSLQNVWYGALRDAVDWMDEEKISRFQKFQVFKLLDEKITNNPTQADQCREF